MKRYVHILSLVLITVLSLKALAVKMDYETHDDLISRLEDTRSSMPKKAPEMTPVMYRLAGLYADRARLKSLNEVEKNCNNCLKSKDDRSKAIELFKATLSSQPKENQGEVLIQIAHLSNINSKEKNAEKIFKDIVKNRKKYSSRVVSLAHLNLAELEFKKANYKSALKLYTAAAKGDLPDPGFVKHRQAWCHVNLGQDKKAIQILTQLLSSPEMVKEVSFHEDVSFDFATILARAKVTQKEIDLLLSLSPESKRKTNLKILADETERLGKNGSAFFVWKAYANEPGFTKMEQVETQIRLAQIQFDVGNKISARQEYRAAIDLWKDIGCKDEVQCKELQDRYRRFVTSWNKVQKSSPDAALLQAYEDYLSLFSNDLDMTYWAAFTAKNLKDHAKGVRLFRASAILARDQKNSKLFEGSLLGEIEMAEGSKRNDFKVSAYTNYIEMNPNGDQAVNVRFQRALIWQSEKKYQEAFSEFHQLATQAKNSKSHRDIRLKSADMSLDVLAAMKDHAALQLRSLEYSNFYPERKNEYLKISRTAVLNQVSTIMAAKNSGESEAKAALKKLKEYPLAGASKDEKIKLFKNQIVLGEQLNDADTIENAANSLYNIKGLSDSDNTFALQKLAWVAELKLNFKLAYQRNLKLAPKKKTSSSELKLAILSELAGLNSTKHYQQFLKLEKNRSERNFIRASLVKKSNRPWTELKSHLKDLKFSPALLAEVALDAYGKTPSDKELNKLFKSTKIANFPEGQTLKRQAELKELKSFDKSIAKHRLNSRNDTLLQKSLKARLKLLAKADQRVKSAIKAKDWSLQVSSLAIVARENERLNKDLLSLPVPRALKGEQVAQYNSLIKQQAEVYRQKAENVSNDINALFANENLLSGIEKALSQSPKHVRQIMENELKVSHSLVRGSAKSRLERLLNIPSQKPSYQDLLIARNSVKEDPFNTNKLERLQVLEQRSGSGTMAGYLDARITAIKKGKNL